MGEGRSERERKTRLDELQKEEEEKGGKKDIHIGRVISVEWMKKETEYREQQENRRGIYTDMSKVNNIFFHVCLTIGFIIRIDLVGQDFMSRQCHKVYTHSSPSVRESFEAKPDKHEKLE